MRLHLISSPRSVCPLTYPFFLPSVCGEVVHRDLHALALLEFAESVHQQAEVKGIWMVKVVIVISSQQLLFGRQNLQKRRHGSYTSDYSSNICQRWYRPIFWSEIKAANWKVVGSKQTRADPWTRHKTPGSSRQIMHLINVTSYECLCFTMVLPQVQRAVRHDAKR